MRVGIAIVTEGRRNHVWGRLGPCQTEQIVGDRPCFLTCEAALSGAARTRPGRSPQLGHAFRECAAAARRDVSLVCGGSPASPPAMMIRIRRLFSEKKEEEEDVVAGGGTGQDVREGKDEEARLARR